MRNCALVFDKILYVSGQAIAEGCFSARSIAGHESLGAGIIISFAKMFLTLSGVALGGFEKFTTDFNAAGGRVFGSGWVFVTVAKDGKLAIETRPNQDSPIMDGKRALLGNDVWEHAYYLNYQNRRADYLKAWWNTVSWSKIAERYAAAKAGTLGV